MGRNGEVSSHSLLKAYEKVTRFTLLKGLAKWDTVLNMDIVCDNIVSSGGVSVIKDVASSWSTPNAATDEIRSGTRTPEGYREIVRIQVYLCWHNRTAWLAQSVERTTLSTSRVWESYGRGFEPRIGLSFLIFVLFLFLSQSF